jgi:hypothetical protein
VCFFKRHKRIRISQGVPLARGEVRINNLFFADDSLLFCKAYLVEWRN